MTKLRKKKIKLILDYTDNHFVNSGIVMGIGSILPGASMPLFFSMGYSSRLSRFLLAEQAAKKALPELKERLENHNHI